MKNMKNISKRALALFLTLVMCLGMVNVTVFADEVETASESALETIEERYTCGKEEHEHTDECYVKPECEHEYEDGICTKCEAEKPKGETNEDEPKGETNEDESKGETNEGETKGETNEGESKGETNEDESKGETNEDESKGETNEDESKGETNEDEPKGETNEDEPKGETNEDEPKGETSEDEPKGETSEDEPKGETNEGESKGETSEGESKGETEEQESTEPVTVAFSTEEQHFFSANTTGEGEETPEDEETVQTDADGIPVYCGKKEHVHTLKGCTDFEKLCADVETFGNERFAPMMEQFQETVDFSEFLDEDGEMDSRAMAEAFAAMAAPELGEEFNALIDRLHQIPSRFAEDADFVELAATMTNLAGQLGGDLDNGIEMLATGDWEDVKSKLESGQNVTLTQNITGSSTITITKNVTLDLNGHTVQKTGNSGSVFKVTGGTFTLKDSSNQKRTLTKTVDGKPVTVSVDQGTVKGGRGTAAGNIINYNEKGTRKAMWSDGRTLGGAVFVGQNAAFRMYGGTIMNNTATVGGGIYVDTLCTKGQDNKFSYSNQGYLYLYGGSVCNNTATGQKSEAADYGGGGIWVYGTAVINPTVNGGSDVTVFGNVSNTTNDLGGGGIYVNSGGSLQVTNAIITDNVASGLGGGVASCVHGKVALVSSNGTAIYNNTGKGNCVIPNIGSVDVDGSNAWKNSANFKTWAQDVLSAGNSNEGNSGTVVTNERFDGQMHNWKGYGTNTATGTLASITPDNNGVIYGGYALGLTAQNKAPVNTAGRKTVMITGNTSASHGGGIGCNGVLKMGATTNEMTINSINGDLELTVGKTLKNKKLEKNQFEFELLDSNGSSFNPAITAKNSAPGTNGEGIVTLPYGAGITKNNQSEYNNSYTFYVKEKSKSDDNVIYSTAVFKVVVTVAKDGAPDTKNVGDFLKVHMQKWKVTSVKFTEGTGVGSNWQAVTGATPSTSATFENTWKMGKLAVTKTVSNSDLVKDGDKFSFKVTIGTDEFTFDLANGETWTSEKEYPVGTKYTVTETGKNSNGYSYVSGEVNNGTITEGTHSVTVTNKRDTASLSVAKKVTWNTDQSLAPENLTDQAFTVVVTLGNGEGEKVTGQTGDNAYVENGVYTFTLKPGNGNGTAGTAATITGIPTGTKYTVEEVKDGLVEKGHEGYAYESGEVNTPVELTANETVTIENRYFKTKTTSVTVKKEWKDGDKTANEYLPEVVSVKLNGGPDTLAVNRTPYLWAESEPEWTHTWNDLPMYEAEGKPYSYSVEETAIEYPITGSKYTADPLSGNLIRVRNQEKKTNKGEAEIVGGWLVDNGNKLEAVADGTITITNKWLGKEDAVKASITIHKVDAEKPDLSIPGVQFELTCPDGTKFPYLVTNENGIITVPGLEMGKYTLKEVYAHEGYVDESEGRTWEITIGKGDKLQKVEQLNDEGNADQPVGKNTWSWTDSTGTEMPNEEGVISWKASDNCLGGTLTITNQVIKGKISIKKSVKVDGPTADADRFKDESFTFTVTPVDVFGLTETDAKTVTVKPSDTEPGIVENLRYGTYKITEAETKVDGYTWTGVSLSGSGVAELKDEDGKVIGYTVDVHGMGDGTIAVSAENTYTRDTGKLTIAKKVEGNIPESLYKDKEFSFTVEGPAGTGEYSGWAFENGKATVTIKGAGSAVIENLPTGEYTVTENEAAAKVSGYSLSVSIISPVKVEKDKETVSDVTNNYSENPRTNYTNLSVEKVWAGDDENVRPTSIKVQLLRKTSKNGEFKPYGDPVTLSAKDGWKHKWTSLNGDYTWSVEEVDVPADYDCVVELNENGKTFTITNTYNGRNIPLGNMLSVNKVWLGDAGANRPDSVSVRIFRDGELAETVTLNEANGWSWSKTLSVEELKSTWTVSEINVPEGYTSTVSGSGTSFTVTNSFGDTDIPEDPTPTTDVPDNPPPLVDWPDYPPPLVDWPPLVEIPEDPVPMVPAEPEVDIPEDPTPMVGIPQTGDISLAWYGVAALSACGLIVLAFKKREDEEN